MKRMLIIGSIAALATVGLAGTASATPNPDSKACFGGIHKAINAGALGEEVNVGTVVKALGGQGKNEVARGLCSS